MSLTVSYILSQIFTITMYGLTASTYYIKDRNKILILNCIALISIGIAYILLNAWTGLAMCVVSLIRNIVFLLDEKKYGKRDTINKRDIIILLIVYAISIILAIFTYNGFLSLLSVFATALYTYSVWQKKTNIYKMLGIPIGILWIAYNIYIMSIVGMILETVLLICSISGYVLEVKSQKQI